jgi:hypothetical protein
MTRLAILVALLAAACASPAPTPSLTPSPAPSSTPSPAPSPLPTATAGARGLPGLGKDLSPGTYFASVRRNRLPQRGRRPCGDRKSRWPDSGGSSHHGRWLDREVGGNARGSPAGVGLTDLRAFGHGTLLGSRECNGPTPAPIRPPQASEISLTALGSRLARQTAAGASQESQPALHVRPRVRSGLGDCRRSEQTRASPKTVSDNRF